MNETNPIPSPDDHPTVVLKDLLCLISQHRAMSHLRKSLSDPDHDLFLLRVEARVLFLLSHHYPSYLPVSDCQSFVRRFREVRSLVQALARK